MRRFAVSSAGALFRRFPVSSTGAFLRFRRKPIRSDRTLSSSGSQSHVLGLGSGPGTGGRMAILSCPIKGGTCKSIMTAERVKVDQARERNMHWSCSKCTPVGHVSTCLFTALSPFQVVLKNPVSLSSSSEKRC